MIRIYRVLRKRFARHPFDGEGAYRFGGRWSSPGVRLCYTSEHASLALLEYFVHLDQDDPPADLILAAADVPDSVSRLQVAVGGLPLNWRDPAAPQELTAVGDEFVREGRCCVLLLPSVIAPTEHNWLLNPAHSDFARITVQESTPVAYDPRLFPRSRRSGHA